MPWQWNTHGIQTMVGWLWAAGSWQNIANLTWHVEHFADEYFWVVHVWWWGPDLGEWRHTFVNSECTSFANIQHWMVHED